MKHIYILIFLSLSTTCLFSQAEINDSIWIEQHFDKRTLKFEYGINFGEDMIPYNFNEFQPVLKSYNTEILNLPTPPILWGISGKLNRFTLGLQFGTVSNVENNHDSLKIKLIKTVYGINFGYNLIDNKHWEISPLVSLKWYRYRILNSSKNYGLPLNEYLRDRDLDLRINQAMCITGISIAYKVYKFSYLPCDFMTIGLHGGYPFKLHEKPLLFAKQNKLTSDYKINYANYYLAFYISFNAQIW